MSDHIAHLAICDDVFRLAAFHPALPATFIDLMDSERDICHMGCVTRSADKWSAELIVAASDVLERSTATDPNAARKLSFVLGALTHRSADRHMKPITRCWKDPAIANESKIYQDLFAFREVYHGGTTAAAAPFHWIQLLNPTSDADEQFESYYRVLLRRALIAMHTLNPDKGNIDNWLDRFFDGLQTFPKSLRQYASINAEWDPAKVKRYLHDKHFYDRDDALIQLARGIQHNTHSPSADELHAAVTATSDASSRWARTLKVALDYLTAAAELFTGTIDLNTAKARLDIGVPELALGDHRATN